MTPARSSDTMRILAALALAAGLLALSSCGGPAARVGSLSKEHIPEAVQPPVWDLSSPESAVHSYLDWTAFAYRLANSDVASKTAEPTETVRVDSYIELNRQEGNKGIDQHLTEFGVTRQSVEGTRATVSTRETWKYRYFSLPTQRYTTCEYTTSYEATYTVVQGADGWRVDKVDAKALGEVH